MGDIIDFIFSNFIIVLLVIGGLARLFGSNKDDENQNTNRPKQPVQTRQSSQRKTNERPVQSRPIPGESSVSNNTHVSIEEQQQQQLERLAGRMTTTKVDNLDEMKKQTYSKEGHHALNLNQLHQEKEYSKSKQEVQKQFSKKLNKNGLIDSVIMAEVLGPPRARKPYKNVVTRRNQ